MLLNDFKEKFIVLEQEVENYAEWARLIHVTSLWSIYCDFDTNLF